ncbi:MAG TPA: hypothetical protein VEY30_02915, partial [Myxococcaceae bacterium]|nr:hypothetical protein [Myxococcaceae bacterium]
MNQESNRGVNPANRTGNSTRRAESGREEGFDSGLKSLMDWARGDGSQETGRYRIQERLRAACPSKIYREAVAGAFLAGNAAQLRGPVQTAAWETVKALGRHPDDPLSWALAAELAGLAVSAEEPGSASLPVEVREWEVALVKEVLSTSELRAESAAVRDALSTRDGQQG